LQDARVFGITPNLPPYQDTAQLFEAYAQFGEPEGNGFSPDGPVPDELRQ
jgi:hypothetical protein